MSSNKNILEYGVNEQYQIGMDERIMPLDSNWAAFFENEIKPASSNLALNKIVVGKNKIFFSLSLSDDWQKLAQNLEKDSLISIFDKRKDKVESETCLSIFAKNRNGFFANILIYMDENTSADYFIVEVDNIILEIHIQFQYAVFDGLHLVFDLFGCLLRFFLVVVGREKRFQRERQDGATVFLPGGRLGLGFVSR